MWYVTPFSVATIFSDSDVPDRRDENLTVLNKKHSEKSQMIRSEPDDIKVEEYEEIINENYKKMIKTAQPNWKHFLDVSLFNLPFASPPSAHLNRFIHRIVWVDHRRETFHILNHILKFFIFYF